MDAERLAEIKARCEAATRGPWESIGNKRYGDIRSSDTDERIAVDLKRQDADFAAHARTDVPDLLAEVAACHALLREIEWLAWDEQYDYSCVVCGEWKEHGHKPDCKLANLIGGK